MYPNSNDSPSHKTIPLESRPKLHVLHAPSDNSTSSGSSNTTVTRGHSDSASQSTPEAPSSPLANATGPTSPTAPIAPPKKKRLVRRPRPSTAPSPDCGPRPPLLPARSAAVVPRASRPMPGATYDNGPVIGYTVSRGRSPGRDKGDDSPPRHDRRASIGTRGKLGASNAEFARAVESTVIDGVLADGGESEFRRSSSSGLPLNVARFQPLRSFWPPRQSCVPQHL